jgi:dimethylargininase
MRMAITRPVPASLADCELTHLNRVPIDVGRAAAQHDAYEAALQSLGCTLRRLPATDDLPDSVFVEDIAIVLDELAIVTRPGAASRRPERATVAPVVAEYRPVRTIEAPGTIDGGDVLRIGRRLFVGLSGRTNDEGVRQLAALTGATGYQVIPVPTEHCLHLKSAATALSPTTVLCNPEWIDTGVFSGLEVVAVAGDEPSAGNVLALGHTILMAAGHERTTERLRARGHKICPVDVSELAKAEAGVTCCSLVF